MPKENNPFWSGIGGAITSGLSGLFGGFMQGNQSQRNVADQASANMNLARYQYQMDLDQWNRSNAYNSPQEQMKRLEAAGLNPNMVYGSGSAAGNTTSAASPQMKVPTTDYSQRTSPLQGLPSVLSMFQDFQIKQAQTDNLRAQKDAIIEGTRNRQFENRLFDDTYEAKRETAWEKLYKVHEDQLLTKQRRDQGEKIFPYQLEYAKGKINQQSKAVARMEQQTETQKLINDWYVTKMFSQLGLQAINTLGKFVPGKQMFGNFNQNKRKP